MKLDEQGQVGDLCYIFFIYKSKSMYLVSAQKKESECVLRYKKIIIMEIR